LRSSILYKGRRALKKAFRRTSKVALAPNYANFFDALAECGDGYMSSDIADVVCAKTARLMSASSNELPPAGVQLAAAALAGRTSPVKVIDVGGAAGAHYLSLRPLIHPAVGLEWVVVETQEMVLAARKLPHSTETQFESSLEAALARLEDGPDLLLASGVLMCLPDPISALKAFVGTGARTIVFTRTGLSPDDETRIMVQSSRLSENGPGPLPEGFVDQTVRYPNTFIPQAEFEKILKSRYEIRYSAIESPRGWSFGPHPIPQHAYVAALR